MLLDIRAVVVSTALFASALGESSSSGSSTSTSSAPGATHTVSVGADGFNFSPRELFAEVGDIIEYRFYPQNHSVARAAFGPNPCIPYELTGPGRVGFWSGFEPIALVLSNPPIFRVAINDSEPVFFYCSAPGACLQGMIGVVNPNSTFTFDAQFNYTQNATVEFSPGEYFPKEVALTRTTTATGATFTPTPVSSPTSAAATTTAATAPATSNHKSTLSGGAIAGIAIGGFAVLVLAAALIYMCGRQKTIKEVLRQSQLPPPHPTSYQPASPGMSEAHYSNMHKSPDMSSNGRFSPYGIPPTETESYRSMSPPIDERTGMMRIPPMTMRNGQPSPGSPPYDRTGFVGTHEMDNETERSYNPHDSSGPHELAVPSRNPSSAQPQSPAGRPFSYTDSESGYAGHRRDDKIDPQMR